MAYSTAVLNLFNQTVGGTRKIWWMENTDATTAVDGIGYISDATSRGMKAGDLVIYIKTDASPLTLQLMIVTAVSAAGAADLSDGTAITSTNSD